MISVNPRFVIPWPWWKKALHKVWSSFEWGDYEYVRFTVGKWPYAAWITVYEPQHRRSWHRRMFPYRIRFAWATLLKQMVCSACTRCNRRFALRELLVRDDSLMYFQSGSICHKECRRD